MKTERDAATAEVADLKAKVANLEKSLETSNDNISRMEKERDNAVAQATENKQKLDVGFAAFTKLFNQVKKGRAEAFAHATQHKQKLDIGFALLTQ